MLFQILTEVRRSLLLGKLSIVCSCNLIQSSSVRNFVFELLNDLFQMLLKGEWKDVIGLDYFYW